MSATGLREGLRARLARERRGQDGYVLGVVLAAMVVGLTLVTALLGLSFATHASAIAQQRLARERRAVDGALEVGVETLRSAPDPAAACSSLPVVPMDSNGSTPPDESVPLDCQRTLDPTPGVGPLQVVGDDYEGGLGFTSGPVAAGPGALRHAGPDSLRIVGNTRVSSGAVLDASPESPGAFVSGSYEQGDVCPDLTGPLASRTLVDAEDGEPSCGGPFGPNGATSPTMAAPGDVPLSALPSCAPTVTLSPGLYGPTTMVGLNALLASCPGATFVFAPTAGGDVFWFDAGATGSLRFVPGSTYVFGTRDASAPGECDPEGAGVSVVLGAGTGIDHAGGAVSICGRGPDRLDTLVQVEVADTQPELTVISNQVVGFTNPGGLVGDPAPDLGTWPRATFFVSQPNRPTAVAQVHYAGGAPVSDLRLRFKSWEYPPAAPMARNINVQLTKPGVPPVTCNFFTQQRGRTDGGMGTELDLGSCLAGKFESPGNLDGARLTLLFWPEVPFDSGIRVTDLELVTNSVVVDTETSGSFTDAPAAGSNDSSYAFAEKCTFVDSVTSLSIPHVCSRGASIPTSDLILKAAKPPGVDDADPVTSLTIALDQAHANDEISSTPPNLYSNFTASASSPGAGETEVALDDGSGSFDCIEYPSYTRSRATVVLDVSKCISGMTFGDLDDLTATISMTPESLSYVNGLGFRNAGVELPWIRYARMIATTDAVDGHSNISLNLGAGNTFHVYGDTVAPNANVDVTWTGTASDVSVFNGRTAVWSIGSLVGPGSEAGVICCGPDLANLAITASIDGTPRGLARLRLEEGPTPADTSAVITDWQLCDGGGCDVDAVAVGPSP